MTELLLKEEVYAVIGAAMEVYSELGPGFSEAVYHEALELELEERVIPFESEKSIRIHYKGRLLEKEYFADLVCYEQILVELKALDALTSKEEAQILNYLRASQMPVGLLINFGSKGKSGKGLFIDSRSTRRSTKDGHSDVLMNSNSFHAHVNLRQTEEFLLFFFVVLRVLRG